MGGWFKQYIFEFPQTKCDRSSAIIWMFTAPVIILPPLKKHPESLITERGKEVRLQNKNYSIGSIVAYLSCALSKTKDMWIA